jgi:nitrogen fixation protein NifU and related proteins
MGRFSETLMDHFTSPRHTGSLEAPDCVGQAGTLGQGPFMVIQLRLVEDRVADVRFQTYGCGVSIACGSALTELVLGRTIAECEALAPEDIVTALERVPPDKAHGPVLAITALRAALASRPVSPDSGS